MSENELNDGQLQNYLKMSALSLKQAKAIESVRELHKEDNTGYCELCTAIATPDGSDYLSKYPCPTIKALNGDLDV